jgi:cytochrome c553
MRRQNAYTRLQENAMRKPWGTVLCLALVVPSVSFAADLTSDPNFKAKCAVCHGTNGEGKAALKTPPMKTAAGKSEADLIKIIENGTTTTPKMPAYKGQLTAAAIKTLVAEIKALK